MSETFGEFVRRKRKDKGITLRGFAKQIGISPVYESNIEQGTRTAPKGEVLYRIVKELSLNKKEADKLFDLASESKNFMSIPYDICCYINNSNVVKHVIRLADTNNISDDKWKEFISNIS